MIEIPRGLPAELVPLAWLLGIWEGTGVLDYKIGEESVTREFGQRVSFSHDGLPHLSYNSYTWLLDSSDDAGVPSPLATEAGYWRLARQQGNSDPGPAMLPASGPPAYQTAEQVETLRNAAGGFDVQLSLVHPGGVNELYLGQAQGPRIDLATDAVLRGAGAKEYSAATRMYGLVEDHLLWAWDIAALGQELRTHASARLARVE